MKKIILSSIVASTILLSSANAGVILDFEAGAGTWNAAPSGHVNYGDKIELENDLGLKSSNNLYFYADFNHFVPLIPNVRIEKQELKVDATGSLGSISFGTGTYNSATKTTIDLTQTDLILYWGIPGLNLLTAGILDVNFGLDLKQFDGGVTLENSLTGTNKTTADMSFVVPMGYVSATIDPPFIPATIGASYKIISYKDSKLSEAMAKLSINLPIPIPLIDIKADIGYKEQVLTIDNSLSDNLTADIKFSGMFFGISAKF
ncbi:MAG: hypothetical protein DRG78_03160 [Epsilonproteobacteria bacterium]|nr:MAG: hypothetical protein DRG78_03160 [Campylobacterota bacterium]